MTSRAARGWPGELVSAAGLSGPEALAEACGVPGWLVIADELPDGLVIADETGRVAVFNRAAARLTGTDPAEALGKDLFGVLPLHDADGRDWWDLTDPYHGLQTRTRHPERPLYLADGTEVLVVVRYIREPHRRRAVLRLVISLHDASQRARLERSRADLVSTVAHELRSPLTSVQGFTAALLDVSRIESGRLEVHRQLVDVPERARKIIAGRVAAGEPEDRFRLQARAGRPETWLDPDKVDQILSNLVENAVRHGAGTVTVVVEPAAGTDAVTVFVQDEGEGIAPDLASRVFRQFWRGKRRGGTGLGLYIVKGLVEAHGGTISVGRAPGGGAEFRFTMPAGTPAA